MTYLEVAHIAHEDIRQRALAFGVATPVVAPVGGVFSNCSPQKSKNMVPPLVPYFSLLLNDKTALPPFAL
jgi:hypothetical protein